MNIYSKVLKERENINTWRVMIEQLEDMIEDAHHNIDTYTEAIENGKIIETEDSLSIEDLHKVLCVLDHSVILKDEFDEEVKSALHKIKDELSNKLSNKLGYDIEEGTINPLSITFEKF